MDPAFKDQLIGMLRIFIPVVLSAAVARGWFTPADSSQITKDALDIATAAIDLGAIVWSFMAHRQSAQIKRVAKMDDVVDHVTVKSEQAAEDIDHPKVMFKKAA